MLPPAIFVSATLTKALDAGIRGVTTGGSRDSDEIPGENFDALRTGRPLRGRLRAGLGGRKKPFLTSKGRVGDRRSALLPIKRSFFERTDERPHFRSDRNSQTVESEMARPFRRATHLAARLDDSSTTRLKGRRSAVSRLKCRETNGKRERKRERQREKASRYASEKESKRWRRTRGTPPCVFAASKKKVILAHCTFSVLHSLEAARLLSLRRRFNRR